MKTVWTKYGPSISEEDMPKLALKVEKPERDQRPWEKMRAMMLAMPAAVRRALPWVRAPQRRK
jgi:hypothetical protein